jgi:hypothetical protein
MSKGSTDKIATGAVRRPYTKPAFRYERVFETQVMKCHGSNCSRQGNLT